MRGRKQEIKSRKVTMGYRPSVYEKFQKIAYIQSVSPNQILAEYMEKYVKAYQSDLDVYDELQQKKFKGVGTVKD